MQLWHWYGGHLAITSCFNGAFSLKQSTGHARAPFARADAGSSSARLQLCTMPFNAVEVVASQCGFLSCTVVQPRTYHWPTSRFRLSRRVCPFVQHSPPGKIPPDPLRVPLKHSRKKGRGWNKIPKTLTWLSTGMPELPVTL